MKWIRLAALIGLLAGCSHGAPARTGAEVTLTRDTFGVPHVFAATTADAAFGLGYAQAEDRAAQLAENYRLALGRMAEVRGATWVERDWEQRLAGHDTVCQRRYPELPADVRALCEGFVAGVRACLADHPALRPAEWLDLEPWMVPAVFRLLTFHWPLGHAKQLLGQRDQVRFFSNEWAVRPDRTADGATILCTDPHVPLEGPFRFYELRLHAGGLNLSGFAPVGAPFVALGHNDHVAWALTTGGPLTTDVYVEQLDPDNPRRYRYDDGWRELSGEPVTINVRGAAPVVRQLERSHHGPVAARADGKAYAIACPYLDQIDIVTQTWRMDNAHNLTEFDEAVAMRQLMEQNLMVADVDGHIQYVRNGRVPIRPAGFDFRLPVPGNTSRSEWLGLHPFGDLVQVLDPPQGYLQNCNLGPDMMARGLQLDPAAYPSYLYNVAPGATNSRGRRITELLEAHPKLTVEDAQSFALDIHADKAEEWLAALRAAAPAADPRLRPALDVLLAWNGEMEQTSTAATLYRAWRQRATRHDPKLGDGAAPPPAPLLLTSLTEAVGDLTRLAGQPFVPYGQVHRLRRGQRSWPVSGGDSGGGSTLRALSAYLDGQAYYVREGQNWTQVIQLRRGAVRSWTATPFGQSDDPASPHYCDQAEQLFSPRKLKPTWFAPEELAQHTESTEVLRR